MHERRSEINKSYKIDEKQWVLTLARKTEGSHQEHAFFILEGIKDGKAVIWFMDLVGPFPRQLLPNILKSKVRVKNFCAETKNDLENSPLIYRCSIPEKGKFAKMMDLKEGDGINLANTIWFISNKKGEELIKSIENDIGKEPPFNILGKDSKLTESSAYMSSKDRGHNCFTYAKEKIEQLNDPRIKLECDKFAYCLSQIASLSSLILKSPKSKSCYSLFWSRKSLIAITATAAFATGVVTLSSYLNQ